MCTASGGGDVVAMCWCGVLCWCVGVLMWWRCVVWWWCGKSVIPIVEAACLVASLQVCL